MKSHKINKNEIDYRDKLFEVYFSSHYNELTPQSEELWQWVIELTHQSFGEFFASRKEDSLILDAGCGVGYLEYYLLKKGFTNITAIDVSEEQINMAKGNLERFNLDFSEKINFIKNDIFEFLESSSKFDIISLIDVVEHFPKNEAFELLELSWNKLNKDGIIIVRVPNMEHPLLSSYNFYQDFTHETAFTRPSLKQCLIGVNFGDVEVNFEKWLPFFPKNNLDKIKNSIVPAYYRVLGSILRVPPDSFCPNIIGTGKKLR